MNYFSLQPLGFLSPLAQIVIITGLFILTTFYQYQQVKKTGKMYRVYPVSVTPVLAPIYEEIIFRGFLLLGLLNIFSVQVAFVISCLLFCLWHFKNIFWEEKRVFSQMAYAGFIAGPIFAIATLWTGTIWLGVILHYLNNLWSPISLEIFHKLKSRKA